MERTKKRAVPAIPNQKKKIKRVEQSMQIAVFDNVRALLATGVEGFYAFHVPNGGGRSKAEAKILKGMGVMPGVADIVFMFWHGTRPLGDEGFLAYCPASTVFVEMKKPRGPASKDQKDFGTRCDNMGFDCRIWAPANAIEAKALVYGLLREYGVRC